MDANKQMPEQENLNTENMGDELNNETAPEVEAHNNQETEVVSLEEKMAEIQDKYLRLSAEFDNYRKRTLKERYELIKTAGEDIIQGLLPVVDDFDRAMDAMDKSDDITAVKEGVHLIYDKLINYLKQKGLSEIDAKGKPFDTDNSEAVAKFPVDDASKKGTVIDVAQKGYMLNDKVIRFAKVIVGE